MQGPDPYLVRMGASLPCAVNPEQRAVIDEAHRAFVNYEIYYFSSDEALHAFAAEPYRYTGKVTDPVTRDRFEPTVSSPVRSYGGRTFYLESAETAAKFDGSPETYGVLKPRMKSK